MSTSAEECSDPGYDKSVDYIRKLNNYLDHTKQKGSFKWAFSTEGPADFPKHSATVMLNDTAIGFGKWNTKSAAKKVAAFRALKHLGQV